MKLLKCTQACAIGGFLFFSSLQLNGQNHDILFEDHGVKISSHIENCDAGHGSAENLLILSIENTTDEVVWVHYHLDLSYSGECKTCDDPYGEYTRDFKLEPGETIKGGCGNNASNLNVFRGWVKDDGTTDPLLTNIELSDVNLRSESFQKEYSDQFIQPESTKDDPEAYAKWKNEWIEKNPEKYEEMNSQSTSKIKISRSEFEKMPAEKQEVITSNPEKYEIVE